MKEDNSLLALSTIRKNRGISLQQIADSTKISIRSLEAIERGEFQKLPGGIYSTSYIRQYARAIDYDESAILAAYFQKSGTGGGAAGPGGGNGKDMFGGFRPASTII
ncbi:MAG: helix-turn-helix domain-containing protein [Acidobacteriia bacterium]|nr:helix-turn-helix domain-containing protein [Terriglobia bacterium]